MRSQLSELQLKPTSQQSEHTYDKWLVQQLWSDYCFCKRLGVTQQIPGCAGLAHPEPALSLRPTHVVL